MTFQNMPAGRRGMAPDSFFTATGQTAAGGARGSPGSPAARHGAAAVMREGQS